MTAARREWLLRLALLSISLLFCAAALEIAARVLDARRGGGKEGFEPVQYTMHDERLGWRLAPGTSATYRRREYTVRVEVNSLGMRDPERPALPPAGSRRVLALGDSFLEGYTVPLEQTVTRRTEAELGRACPTEVLNGGVAAYSTDQEYLWYLDRGRALRPDVVLVFLYYNDIFANTVDRYWGSPKPLLELRGDEPPALANFPVARPAPPDPQPATPEPPQYLRGSAALDWFANRLMRGAPRAFQALSRLGLWEPLGDDGLDAQLLVYKARRGQREVEAAWRQTAGILRALSRQVAADGARFALVYVPSRMEVSDRDWELTRLRFALNERVWDRDLVARRLAAIAAADGYPLLDLTPALRAVDRGVLGGPYFRFDGHWNETGHAAAAAATATFLREQGLLPAGC